MIVSLRQACRTPAGRLLAWLFSPALIAGRTVHGVWPSHESAYTAITSSSAVRRLEEGAIAGRTDSGAALAGSREAGVEVRLESHRLDYYSLKKRVDRPALSSTFVELPSSPLVQSECVIEWEDATGARMRVHVKGQNLPDVLALSRSFWNAD
jgi:hypothetical protein